MPKTVMQTDRIDDHLNEVMVRLFRSLTGARRLAISDWITTNTRSEMRHPRRIDHPDWDEWQVNRSPAYWCYGPEEMDRVPASVWKDSWLAKCRRERVDGAGPVNPPATSGVR